MWSRAAALLLAGYCAAAHPAAAPDRYPSRPIRLIVQYPPGGPTDLIARAVNEPLAQRLGQQVVIDNRGGATTVIGAELAAHAPADGYTLLVATISTLAVNPALNKKLPYDPENDFVAVSMLAAQPYLLVTTAAIIMPLMVEVETRIFAGMSRATLIATGRETFITCDRPCALRDTGMTSLCSGKTPKRRGSETMPAPPNFGTR